MTSGLGWSGPRLQVTGCLGRPGQSDWRRGEELLLLSQISNIYNISSGLGCLQEKILYRKHCHCHCHCTVNVGLPQVSTWTSALLTWAGWERQQGRRRRRRRRERSLVRTSQHIVFTNTNQETRISSFQLKVLFYFDILSRRIDASQCFQSLKELSNIMTNFHITWYFDFSTF